MVVNPPSTDDVRVHGLSPTTQGGLLALLLKLHRCGEMSESERPVLLTQILRREVDEKFISTRSGTVEWLVTIAGRTGRVNVREGATTKATRRAVSRFLQAKRCQYVVR